MERCSHERGHDASALGLQLPEQWGVPLPVPQPRGKPREPSKQRRLGWVRPSIQKPMPLPFTPVLGQPQFGQPVPRPACEAELGLETRGVPRGHPAASHAPGGPRLLRGDERARALGCKVKAPSATSASRRGREGGVARGERELTAASPLWPSSLSLQPRHHQESAGGGRTKWLLASG